MFWELKQLHFKPCMNGSTVEWTVPQFSSFTFAGKQATMKLQKQHGLITMKFIHDLSPVTHNPNLKYMFKLLNTRRNMHVHKSWTKLPQELISQQVNFKNFLNEIGYDHIFNYKLHVYVHMNTSKPHVQWSLSTVSWDQQQPTSKKSLYH